MGAIEGAALYVLSIAHTAAQLLVTTSNFATIPNTDFHTLTIQGKTEFATFPELVCVGRICSTQIRVCGLKIN